ncbi:WD repeat-containing protein 35, partial [Nowakowskiella sp. JEL0078]
ESSEAPVQYVLTISNAIGTAVETKYIDFEPKSSAITIRKKDIKERAFHIDDISTIGSGDSGQNVSDLIKKRNAKDPIVCIAASESIFIVARQSGLIMQFLLPAVTLDQKYSIIVRPQSIALNCNSTKLSVLDISGILKIIELTKRGGVGNSYAMTGLVGKSNSTETRVNIVEDICSFNDLQIKVAALDDIIRDPDTQSKSCIIQLETKSLRDTRNILSQVGLTDAINFVENNPHPRLWRLIADGALEALDFTTAQKAFLKCLDYSGLQFIKKIQKLNDTKKQRAEILSYFGQFEAAEKIYMEIDRKDLAIDLRVRLGDWFRVVQLIKSGGGGDDKLLDRSWKEIGDYYYDRQRWSQAVTYYEQGRNSEQLLECYYILEDYENLEKQIRLLGENIPLLKNIASKFLSVGMCDQSVAALIQAGDVKTAVDICVELNQWNTAVELAEIHKFREIEALLSKYAKYLINNGKKLEAVELYKKANYCQKSSRLLFELAEEAGKSGKNPLLVKKMYVLAALEVERYHQISRSKGIAGNATSALDGLIAEDSKNIMETRFLDNAWRGAEAYHFYLLAQRQYYSGNSEAAVRT